MSLRPLQDDGHERYTTRRVLFARPFVLGSSPEIYAAGAYDVETKEHALEGSAHTAHVRTSTVLIIPTPTGIRCLEVSGSDLDHAIMQDAERRQGEPSENPDRGQAEEVPSPEVLR